MTDDLEPKISKKAISIRIADFQLAKLRSLAFERGTTTTALIIEAIADLPIKYSTYFNGQGGKTGELSKRGRNGKGKTDDDSI